MEELNIDFNLFKKRATALHKAYPSFDDNPNSLLFVIGSSNAENPYQKTTILHDWIIGYEFPATLIAFVPNKIVHFCS